MKKNLLFFLSGVIFTSLFAFSSVAYNAKHGQAQVNFIEGFHVFTDSRPKQSYDSLGVVEIGFITGTQYESIRNNLIKNARKEYPNADGIIIQLDKKGVDKCLVIKFK
jgi:hypothetical protein